MSAKISSSVARREAQTSANDTGHPRRGIALATALIVIVLLGALVAGSVYFTNQDARAATNSRRLQQSFGVAEGGLTKTISTWNPAVNTTRLNYPADTLPIVLTALGASGAYTGSVYKLNSRMYLVDITGRDSASVKGGLAGGGSRQRVAQLMRVVPLVVDIQAAFTVGGPVQWGGGNTFVKGADATPPGWSGCQGGPSVAGVRAKSLGDLGASQGQFTGSPDSVISPAMDSSTFTNFGQTNYATLASQATIQLSGGTYAPVPSLTGGKCNYANAQNWGDGNTPANPCGSYFPIVHITGNALINGTSQGQGMLLVDGNLTISGTFKYYGMIVVKGGFSTQNGGSPSIYGTILARSVNTSSNAFAGDVNIQYSKCAVERTMDATGVATPVRSRSFIRVM
jgi:hypothetical protein